MCPTCKDKGVVVGRVDHVRFSDRPSRYTAASNPTSHPCWRSGTIPCPYCFPHEYGTITKIEIAADLPKSA